MKDAFWLRHDSNAQHDERILELRAEFGWEGYGLFWAMVERMRDAQGYRLAMATMGGLATSMGLLKPKLLALIDLCCTHGLFAMDEEKAYVFSPSLCRRMEEWDTKKAALADAGKRGQAAKKAKQAEATPPEEASQAEATLKPPLSHPDDFLSREEKSREEERREEQQPSSLRSENAATAAAPAQKKIEPEELQLESPGEAQAKPPVAKPPRGGKHKPEPITGPLADLLNAGGLADEVQGMKKPFTQQQADELVDKYGEGPAREIVQEMANWKPLHQKCQSASLTAQNWLNKRGTPAPARPTQQAFQQQPFQRHQPVSQVEKRQDLSAQLRAKYAQPQG